MSFIRQQIARAQELARPFSDVHIEVGEPIRIRSIHGIVGLDDEPVEEGDLQEFLAEAAGPRDWEQLLDAGGGHCDFSVGMDGFRYRCNLHRFGGLGRHALVLRRLEGRIPVFGELGLPPTALRLLQRRSGLILVTGPTGSGKSTTLASFIDHLNDNRACKIVTIEDPIEYVHRSRRALIVQREVGRDVASFRDGLTASFRQDPDCVFIGEMRDRETVGTALAASESGHLVLSTLHTAGAAKSVDRITDYFSGEEKAMVRAVLSSVLIGIVSQVLVPRLDGSGFVPACELMHNTPSIASHIRDGKAHLIANAMATSGVPDMRLMNQSLAQLVKSGSISREEAERASDDPQELVRELGPHAPS